MKHYLFCPESILMLEMTNYFVHENVSSGVVTVNAKIDSAKNGCPVNKSFTVRFKTSDGSAGIVVMVIS